jgi:hypothetical protein
MEVRRAFEPISRRTLLRNGAAAAILHAAPAKAQAPSKGLTLDDASRQRRPDRAALAARSSHGRRLARRFARRVEGGGNRGPPGCGWCCSTLHGWTGASTRRRRHDVQHQRQGRHVDRRRPQREKLPRRGRRSLEAGHCRARPTRLFARGDAVKPRLRSCGYVLGQRAWLAGSLRAVRNDGTLVSRHARFW